MVCCVVGECRGTAVLLLEYWVREWWLYVLSVFCWLLVGWWKDGEGSVGADVS